MADGTSQPAPEGLDRGAPDAPASPGRGATPHDIFISYASKDQDLADRIVREIEHRGLACWISSRDIRPGADYQGSIVAALEQAGVVLLLFSQNANESLEVPKELSLASRRHKPIIPARIEDILPTGALAYQLTHAQFIDLFRNFDNRLNELCLYLAEMLKASGRAERQVRHVAAPKTPIADAMLATAVCAAIIISGSTATWYFLGRHPGGASRAGLQAAAVVSQSAGPDEAAARDAAFGFYAAVSGSAGTALPALATRFGNRVVFYGKSMTRSEVIEVQVGYMQRWPDRSFTVRPQTLQVECDGQSRACVVTGIVDYALRSEARNAAAYGTESFRLDIVITGGVPAVTGVGSTSIARHNSVLHAAAPP